MVHKPQILLLGDSVFMDSVAESLLEMESSNVVRIGTNIHDVREYLSSLNPDLIVYELNRQNTNPILKIINEQADTMHLAIDMDSKQIIQLHCRRKPTESMQELCELISQEVGLKNINEEVY